MFPFAINGDIEGGGDEGEGLHILLELRGEHHPHVAPQAFLHRELPLQLLAWSPFNLQVEELEVSLAGTLNMDF